MKTFESKQTSWEGLWYHPETHGFTSSAINLARLRDFKGTVRIYMRKNSFYKNGENGRPNYVFCIKDAKSSTFTDIEIKDDNRCGEWKWTEWIDGLTIFEGYECNKCGFANGYKTTKYCPECGAKMVNGESFL